MATINATNPTLQDWMSRTDPNGTQAKIVEQLTAECPLLEDAAWKESNTPTGEVITSRTALPSTSWRRFNEGTASSKSRTAQVTETAGMLTGRSVVDVKLAQLNGQEAAFRASEDLAFTTVFANKLEEAFFYSSTLTAPEQIMGFLPRLNSTSGPAGAQIMLHDGSASGSDQASAVLVGWHPEKVYGFFPKGSKAGLEAKDMGEQLIDDGSGQGKTFRAYVTDFSWNVGLAIKDQRYVVRLANIDTGNLSMTGMALIQSMMRCMEEKMKSLSGCRPVWYVNRRISSYLRLQAMDGAKNGTLTVERVGGVPVTMIGGVPVRRTDALLNTEAPIS